MANVLRVKEVLAALTKKQRGHAKGISVGLKRAGLFIQRESQKIVPIEFGLLKNSARTRSEGKGFETEVIVSYGTSYAIYVHENLDARHKQGKKAKFLEIPIRTKQKEIIDIIMGAVARKDKGRGKGWRKGKKGKAKGQ